MRPSRESDRLTDCAVTRVLVNRGEIKEGAFDRESSEPFMKPHQHGHGEGSFQRSWFAALLGRDELFALSHGLSFAPTSCYGCIFRNQLMENPILVLPCVQAAVG